MKLREILRTIVIRPIVQDSTKETPNEAFTRMLNEYEKQIRDWIKSKVPDRQEHVCLLSVPHPLVELKEHRTVKDWIKKGHNDCREQTLKNIEEA